MEPETQKQIPGNLLRERRQKLKIRQEDLAQKLGISQSSLSLYEKEKQKIPEDLSGKLCAELGLSAPVDEGRKKTTSLPEANEAWLQSYLDLHKEVLIGQLITNIRRIQKYTLMELIAFEQYAEACEEEAEGENPLQPFHKLPLMFPCELCKQEHGGCLRSLMEEQEEIEAGGEKAEVQEAEEKATVEKATVERPTVEKATVERSTAEKAIEEKATVERSTAEKAIEEKATAEKDGLEICSRLLIEFLRKEYAGGRYYE